MRDGIDAFLHASVLLEELVPGCVVDDLDGLRHIAYGRPKVGVHHEILANRAEPGRVLAVLARHPELRPVYLSSLAPLDADGSTAYEYADLPRVVRNTLMMWRLHSARQTDPALQRLTDAHDLTALALRRGDGVLDVDHFTDAVRCYILDIGGEPVASALLIPSVEDIAVIEHVHTLAHHRRRGHGQRLMHAVHAEAFRLGIRRLVLGANDAGRRLYASLGYEALCRHDVHLVGGARAPSPLVAPGATGEVTRVDNNVSG